jgi:transposase
MKVWAKRHRDLSRHHNRVACRLHSVLCELVPGGIAGEISPAQVTRLLDDIEPAGAVAAARHELAVELVADLVRLDAQRRDARRRITAAVTASQTTVTEVFGVGPIVAATVIGDVGEISRFLSRDHFAAYNGTAPIEVSSGGRRKVFRLSRRGNRRLNHAIHMAAVTQIRHRHSDGRAYYDRKIAEGRSGKEAIRALKRRISDAIYTRLRDDALQTTQRGTAGPGGHPGNDSVACAAGSHPEHRLFSQATPGPDVTLRPTGNRIRPSRPKAPSTGARKAS